MDDNHLVETFRNCIGTSLDCSYNEVNVLLLSWVDNDLGPRFEEELRNLRAVFETEYSYDCFSFPIPVDGSQQRRLNTVISEFIENNSQSTDSLIIVYYAGHCFPNALGQAEWAAFAKGDPKLSWHVLQQLFFLAKGDVLVILDCCEASHIARGLKTDGGRFELIAASAIGAKTPVPGRTSFTRALTRVLKQFAAEGVSSDTLASQLREDPKITETPVFHDFVRKSSMKIRLQRRQKQETTGFMQKPRGYLLFKTPFSSDVTGLQIAEWLKTAPPDNITAVTIEAVVRNTRQMQTAFRDGVFPPGSLFEQLPESVRNQLARHMRSLNTVMATSAEYAGDSAAIPQVENKDLIKQSFSDMENLHSIISEDIETPMLLNTNDNRAAADIESALILRQAVLDDGPCRYTVETSRERVVFAPSPSAATNNSSNNSINNSSNNPHRRRFRFGSIDGRPVIMDKYRYREAPDHTGEPYPQTLQQIRKMTGLLCHPKRTPSSFHILPCKGYFRDRVRQELGLVFEVPPTCDPKSSDSGRFVTLVELYKKHKLVPLGDRIYLACVLAAAVEQFHRVGWVLKSIRSDVIGFFERPDPSSSSAIPEIIQITPLGRFDLAKPYLFGFEYARAGDGTTYLDEDHSTANNLYRHPDRWSRPSARFEKSHDIYALGVVLLEIASWKDIGSLMKASLGERIIANEVAEEMARRCGKILPHQVGEVFSKVILACLQFGARTKGMSEYEAQVHFQENVVRPIKKVVKRV